MGSASTVTCKVVHCTLEATSVADLQVVLRDLSPAAREKINAAFIDLPARDAALSETAAVPSMQSSRHLVLHFDVNMTIVMLDSVSGKSMRHVANKVMSACGWGKADAPAAGETGAEPEAATVTTPWKLIHLEPSVQRPRDDLHSYAEWVEEMYPGQKNKEARDVLWSKFTEAGEPGEALAPHRDAFLFALRLPDGVTGTEAAKTIGLGGDSNFIIPAFFELLLHLKRIGQSFTICFRTFGTDLVGVAHEFNAFCEGRHPLYPKAVFDGRDGAADYRVDFREPSNYGTFFRSDEESAIIFGTLDQPNLKEGMTFYEDKEKFPLLDIVSGTLHTLHQELDRRTSKPCTLALRDYFPFWRIKGMGRDPAKPNGGKLMIFGKGDAAHSHHIFFDDNVTYDTARIVDVRDLRVPEKNLWVQYLLRCHLVRSEPLEAVTSTQYFVEHVGRLVGAYEERLRANRRLRFLLKKAAKVSCVQFEEERKSSKKRVSIASSSTDNETPDCTSPRSPETGEKSEASAQAEHQERLQEYLKTQRRTAPGVLELSYLRAVAKSISESPRDPDQQKADSQYDPWKKARKKKRHATTSFHFDESAPNDHEDAAPSEPAAGA